MRALVGIFHAAAVIIALLVSAEASTNCSEYNQIIGWDISIHNRNWYNFSFRYHCDLIGEPRLVMLVITNHLIIRASNKPSPQRIISSLCDSTIDNFSADRVGSVRVPALFREHGSFEKRGFLFENACSAKRVLEFERSIFVCIHQRRWYPCVKGRSISAVFQDIIQRNRNFVFIDRHWPCDDRRGMKPGPLSYPHLIQLATHNDPLIAHDIPLLVRINRGNYDSNQTHPSSRPKPSNFPEISAPLAFIMGLVICGGLLKLLFYFGNREINLLYIVIFGGFPLYVLGLALMLFCFLPDPPPIFWFRIIPFHFY